MPNRYLPSALAEIVADVHDTIIGNQDKGDDSDYVPEHVALVSMMKPEYQKAFAQRRDLDDKEREALDV